MKRHLILALAMTLSLAAWAAPLKNIEVRLTQPDGQVIQCFASGDEFYNYLHDANGYTIVKGDGGYYCYATKDAEGNVVASTYVVGSVDPTTVGLQPKVTISQQEYYARRQEFEKHLRQPAQPKDREVNHGEYNNLVVFIRFAGDTYHNTAFSEVDSMFNAANYGAVSLHNFFHRATYNQLDLWSYYAPQPDGETILSYEDIHPKQYYQPYDPVTNPIGYFDEERAEREFSLLERAIEYIEDMVPEGIDFDYNDDGFVDNVVFVVKGEVGAWNSLLWPHRWNIWDRTVMLGDLQVYDFNFQLEAGGYFTVGTLCHEMNHSLNAPDLYHYDGGFDPVGAWDLMCSNTNPPQHMSAYMKYKYGTWITEIPDITNQPGVYEIEPVSWEGNRRNIYKVRTSNPNQYYVIEYRDNRVLFDKQLPGTGLLVYRIDTRFDGNAGWNGYDTFDEVYVFHPGGNLNNEGDLNGANFCANWNRTLFDHTTDPQPFFTNGTVDEVFRLCDISETGDRMRFTYRPFGQGDGVAPGPKNFLVNVHHDSQQVEFSWCSDENADGYNVYCDGVLIGEHLTDTTFAYPFTEADKGYHVYSVASLFSDMSVRSAFTEEWGLIGDYEAIHLEMRCDDPNGTKGGEVEVSFDHPSMKTQYLTVYRGTENTTDFFVPANTEVTFRWLSGFDPEGEGVHVTATHANELGSGVIFDLDRPTEGVLATYTVNTQGMAAFPPQHLTAVPDGDNVDLRWTVQAETPQFNVYRNGRMKGREVQECAFYDDQIIGSGCQVYQVAGVAGDYLTMDRDESAHVVVWSPYCEAPVNLTGVHQDNGLNELSWEAPQMVGVGMYAYCDNVFVRNFGDPNQKWGIKVEPEQLARFGGQPLTHLEMFDCQEGSYKFKIYSGDKANNSTLLLTQQQVMTGSHSWVRFALNEEVAYDVTQPLWIGVESPNVSGNIPACAYTGEDNGSLVILGSNWKPLSDFSYYLTWMLRAYTRPLDGDDTFSYNLYCGAEEADDWQMALVLEGLTSNGATHASDADVRYNVTAIWNGKETEFSNSVFLGPSVGVATVEDEATVHVYPNPTRGLLTVQGKDLRKVTVYTLTGQSVYEAPVSADRFTLDLGPYGAGMYLVQLVSDSEVVVRKVTVME